ncbi:MAG TPA: tetratricopeptide repeat protein [Terriglobia bacterium]|nr:tetratricopeptide repeat protein [Terriglobia bacterium]
MNAISAALLLLIAANLSFAQIDEARAAIARGEFVRAVNILTPLLAEQPSADAYLYLGIAYRSMKEYEKAQEMFREGAQRYPDDGRFHFEMANLFLENNDTEAARSELERTLDVEPDNAVASDLLATIDMSEGDVQSALRWWNRSGRPVVDDILHNYYLNFGSWVVRKAVAFHPAGVLHYDAWKTTESRLFETDNFANVGLEVEPTPVPDHYNAVLRTTNRTNTLSDFAFGIVRGAPFHISFLDLWNLRNTGINFNGNYRWDTDRRRMAGSLKIPLPLPGLLHLEIGNTWRKERWDLSPSILPQFRPQARFDYKSNGIRVHVKHIPHYRVEIGGGLEYRNRAASGDLPRLFTNNANSGRFQLETSLRLVDGRYQNRLHLEGFAARRSILGNLNFSGGVAELDNRFTLSRDPRASFNWSLKAGTARGQLPVEDYFTLGLDTTTENPLRGHTVADHGRFGKGPTGTDFILFNSDFDRRLATLPFFNYVNIPFVAVKWMLFFDGAKTFDRNRIFQQGKLWLDTGGGLRFETPTHSFTIVYGRSLREGTGILYGYVEKRFW